MLVSLLDDQYLTRAQIDLIRTDLARIYLGSDDAATAVALLGPVVESNCAPPDSDVRLLLAEAYVRQRKAAAALEQLDALYADRSLFIGDDIGGVPAWIQLRCYVGGPVACVEHIVSLASLGGLGASVTEAANTALQGVRDNPDVQNELAEARQSGLFDEEDRIIARATRVVALTPVDRVEPEYPYAAVRELISGYVMLELIIATDGSVKNAVVVDESPPNVFSESALRSARKSRFSPKLIDGLPVETTGSYRIVYRIK